MMPAADAPAYAPASDRMCTTAMAAAKGMLPSHDDSTLLQWRREAVQHRVNGHVENHLRVTQAKEQAMENMAKLQQHQVGQPRPFAPLWPAVCCMSTLSLD